MKHYKSVEFLSIFRVSSPPAQTQSALAKTQNPLLKTFWRQFCLNVRSLKISKLLPECPYDHCPCCCLWRKSVQWHGIVEIVLS